jgi:hypothetical protein
MRITTRRYYTNIPRPKLLLPNSFLRIRRWFVKNLIVRAIVFLAVVLVGWFTIRHMVCFYMLFVQFCLPDSIRPCASSSADMPSPPRSFSFVLTDTRQCKTYGSALIFWERVPVRDPVGPLTRHSPSKPRPTMRSPLPRLLSPWRPSATSPQDGVSSRGEPPPVQPHVDTAFHSWHARDLSVRRAGASASASAGDAAVTPPSAHASSGSDAVRFWYYPRALCVLSRHGFYSQFRVLLHSLHAMFATDGDLFAFTDASWTQFLVHVCDELPLPLPGRMDVELAWTAVSGMRPRCRFHVPATIFDFSGVDAPVHEVFEWLDPSVAIQIIACLLCEGKVLLVSRHRSALTPVAESLLALLFPFEWPFVYIPMLPRPLWNFAESPVPYFIGVCTESVDPYDPDPHASSARAYDALLQLDLGDAVIVDLDTGILTPPSAPLPMLPVLCQLRGFAGVCLCVCVCRNVVCC